VNEKQGLGSAIGLESNGVSPLISPPVEQDNNLLGLRGVGDSLSGSTEAVLGSMEPDCDAPETEIAR